MGDIPLYVYLNIRRHNTAEQWCSPEGEQIYWTMSYSERILQYDELLREWTEMGTQRRYYCTMSKSGGISILLDDDVPREDTTVR